MPRFGELVRVATTMCLVVVATSCRGEMPMETRADRAHDVARYVVGAVAEGSASDTSELFGRPIDAESMRQLQEVVPPTSDFDPKRYSAETLGQDEQDAADSLTVRVTSREQTSGQAFLVRLSWNAEKQRDVWVDGEYVETTTGDWAVLGITAEEPRRR